MWSFLYGLVIGAGGLALINWIRDENISLGWYIWPLMGVAFGLGTLALQNFFASYREMEPKAAWMGLLFMGVPALVIAGIVAWLLLPA